MIFLQLSRNVENGLTTFCNVDDDLFNVYFCMYVFFYLLFFDATIT